MPRIQFIFGTYNGLPKGLSSEELETVYQRAYKPFLTALYGCPSVKGTLYYSGVLLDWLEETHPKFTMLLNDMVKRRQIELLGGGYYDPVLGIIPTSDRLGQIEHLTTLVRKRFGRRVRGAWLTEGIWEPTYPSVLKNSGMEYTFLQGDILRQSGYGAETERWPVISEDQGKAVVILPIASALKELILTVPPGETIDKIIGYARGREETLVSIMVDGRSLGAWDDSFEAAYGRNWLEDFLGGIADRKKNMEPVTPGKLVRSLGKLEPVYLSCTSISTDGKYTVGVGGKSFFRQNLSTYPESRRLYSKMIHCHSLVSSMRGDKSRKRTGQIELYKGQGASAYWNDRGGGLYRNSVRKAAYRSLLEAEKITRERGIFKPGIFTADFRLCGDVEYLYQGTEINGYVHGNGATLFELDYLPRSFNYLDTMSRWKEPFHAPEDGPFDTRPREAFHDHFMPTTAELAAFRANDYVETGDFLDAQYETVDVDKDHLEIQFFRRGLVKANGSAVEISVRKTFSFKRNGVTVDYVIANESQKHYSGLFGPEINLSFPGNGLNELRYSVDGTREYFPAMQEEILAIKTLQIQDVVNTVNLTLEAQNPGLIWNIPISTVSRIGVEETHNYQGQCILPMWQIGLAPGASWETSISLTVGTK